MNFRLFTNVGICLLFASFLFTACDKDDDNDDNTSCATAGTMSFKLDGQLFTATSFNNTLINATDNSFGNAKDAKRLDIRGTSASGAQLILSLSEFRDGRVGDGFREDKYYLFYQTFNNGYCEDEGGVTYCNGALGTYFPTSNFGQFYMTTDGDENDTDQYIQITDNDVANRTISGTFKFTINDAISGVVFEVTDGQFNNLCYTVLEQ